MGKVFIFMTNLRLFSLRSVGRPVDRFSFVTTVRPFSFMMMPHLTPFPVEILILKTTLLILVPLETCYTSYIIQNMVRQDFNTLKIPDSPGVYVFLKNKKMGGQIVESDLRRQDILYIGKATTLNDRIKSYFSKDLLDTRGPLLVQMLNLSENIAYIPLDSVLEATILETRLIQKFHPPYNTKSKDNRSFNYIFITKEDYPRVLIIRERLLEKFEMENKSLYKIGPFTNGSSLKEALKILRKIFPFRDKCIPCEPNRRCVPCFNAQIGLCPGVCSRSVSKTGYKKDIKMLIAFFEGKKISVIKDLKTSMDRAIKDLRFEDANVYKKRLYALEHIQDVSMLKREDSYERNSKSGFRIEAYDIAHTFGESMVGVMVVMIDGVFAKSEYRQFGIRKYKRANDTGALKEVLVRRFAHKEWGSPDMIVLDGSIAQLNTTKIIDPEILSGVSIVSVRKDSHHRARDILGDEKICKLYRNEIIGINAEAHRFAISFHRNKRSKEFLNK